MLPAITSGPTHALPSALPLHAQVLTANSLLAVPHSPAMQLCSIFAMFFYYRCLLHLESWYMPGIDFDIPAPPGSPAAADPVLLWLHASGWLIAPARRALFHLCFIVVCGKWPLRLLRSVLGH